MLKIELNDWDHVLIVAMKKQVLLLKTGRSSSGMRRYYEAYTVLDNGTIQRCTVTLAKISGERYDRKMEKLVVNGCGFSPVPDMASALGVSQSIFSEQFI